MIGLAELSLSTFALQAVDTVLVEARDPWDVVVGLSVAVMGFTALVFLVGMGVVLLQVRNALRGLQEVKRGIATDRGVERLRNVADNLDYISHTVRSDTEKLSASVTRASERMEQRLEDFNALMEVLQGEAEGVFLDTASTVRGVKAGARKLGRTDGQTRAAPPAARPEPGSGPGPEVDG